MSGSRAERRRRARVVPVKAWVEPVYRTPDGQRWRKLPGFYTTPPDWMMTRIKDGRRSMINKNDLKLEA